MSDYDDTEIFSRLAVPGKYHFILYILESNVVDINIYSGPSLSTVDLLEVSD